MTAASAAIGLVLLLAVLASGYFSRLERQWIFTVAPDYSPAMNQGVVLAQAALESSDLLPVYAGSELQRDAPDKAPFFFRTAPTGFAICAIGREGSMPLNLLHRAASQGRAARGRKLIVMLSPTWFFMPRERPKFYEGNFSALQAEEIAFNPDFDAGLKRDIAREMLDFPSTVAKRPLLAFALRRLAGKTWPDQVLYETARPLGWVERSILRLQDHVNAAGYIHKIARAGRPRQVQPKELDWPQLLAEADKAATTSSDEPIRPEHTYSELERGHDGAFRHLVAGAEEWRRLDLLCRTLASLGSDVLLLSPPMSGPYLDRLGISEEARIEFYNKLRTTAGRNGLRLIDFEDHESDRTFLADRHDHPSIKGWMYYNETIDRFFHDRL